MTDGVGVFNMSNNRHLDVANSKYCELISVLSSEKRLWIMSANLIQKRGVALTLELRRHTWHEAGEQQRH